MLDGFHDHSSRRAFVLPAEGRGDLRSPQFARPCRSLPDRFKPTGLGCCGPSERWGRRLTGTEQREEPADCGQLAFSHVSTGRAAWLAADRSRLIMCIFEISDATNLCQLDCLPVSLLGSEG
jgi:hypothetical protein